MSQKNQEAAVPAELVPAGDQKSELAPVPVDPLGWLIPAERYALDYYRKHFQKGDSKTFPLSPDLQAGMFRLYLQGRELRDIATLNPTIGYGQIVAAAVDQEWPQQRDTYLSELLDRTRTRAVQAAAEGVEIVADSIAATALIRKGAIEKFLQTGSLDDIKDVDVGSIAQLQKLADLLLRLTGQDQVKKVSGGLTVTHRHVGVPSDPGDPGATLKGWAQEAAAKKAAGRG